MACRRHPAPGRTVATTPTFFLSRGQTGRGQCPREWNYCAHPPTLQESAAVPTAPGPSDYAAVNRLQDQYTLTPLSTRGNKQYVPPTNVPLKKGVDGKTLVNVQVMSLTADQFFNNLNRLLRTNPPYATDAAMLKKLAPLGIKPGATFSSAAFGSEAQKAIEKGVALSKAALAEEAKKLGKIANHWMLTYDMGRYGTRYAYRAAWTFVGIGGNVIEDAFYPLTTQDADGQQLTGEHTYTLTFAKGQWPPAQAFWSITMYDMEGYLVDNPLNRYALGDRSGLSPNQDGSLTIYIQAESPGEGKEANWLPAPKATPFKLSLRLYSPRKSVMDGEWVPPVVQRVK